MFNFMHFGNGWWSVAGLLLDIFGAGMLMYDIVPDHICNLNKARIAAVRRRVLSLNLGTEIKPTAFWAPYAKALIGPAKYANCRAHNNVRYVLGEPEYGPQPFDTAMMLSAIGAVEGKLLEVENRHAGRVRLPLRFAMLLVVAGFILQLFGSIPVSAAA